MSFGCNGSIALVKFRGYMMGINVGGKTHIESNAWMQNPWIIESKLHKTAALDGLNCCLRTHQGWPIDEAH